MRDDLRFFFIDLETSGLQPILHDILEIGCIVTDHKLCVLDTFERVIKPKKQPIFDDSAYKMHTTNGLLDDIAVKGISLEHAAQDLMHFLRKNHIREWWSKEDGRKKGVDPICGASVHFDREFLKQHTPQVLDLFSHRNIDVSTVRDLVYRWHPQGLELFGEPRYTTHRALDDLRNTIDTLAAIRPLFTLSQP